MDLKIVSVVSLNVESKNQDALPSTKAETNEISTKQPSMAGKKTSLGPLHCKLCGKNFKKHTRLLKHMKVHWKAKRFRCAICSQMFQTEYLRNNHRLTHNEFKMNNKDYTPLFELLKVFAKNIDNAKDNVFLSNVEIIKILQFDFQIVCLDLTDLETLIYLRVFKLFLQNWPCWGEFNNVVRHVEHSWTISIDKAMKKQYVIMKQYMEVKLQMAKEQMVSHIEKFERTVLNEQVVKSDTEDTRAVVLEIRCSRKQFNTLFIKKPDPTTDSPISNSVQLGSDTSLSKLNLEDILNCCLVQVSIRLPGFECYRRNTSTVVRRLINFKSPKTEDVQHDSLDVDDVFYRNQDMKVPSIPKYIVAAYLRQLEDFASRSSLFAPNEGTVFHAVLKEFLCDIDRCPSVLEAGQYQFYLSKHKYFRNLSLDGAGYMDNGADLIGGEVDKLDLILEEVLCPTQLLQITKLLDCITSATGSEVPSFNFSPLVLKELFGDENNGWLEVECLPCHWKCPVKLGDGDFLDHFVTEHDFRHEWTCASCEGTWTTALLAKDRWQHVCFNTPFT